MRHNVNKFCCCFTAMKQSSLLNFLKKPQLDVQPHRRPTGEEDVSPPQSTSATPPAQQGTGHMEHDADNVSKSEPQYGHHRGNRPFCGSYGKYRIWDGSSRILFTCLRSISQTITQIVL